jgi:hypothetical protein
MKKIAIWTILSIIVFVIVLIGVGVKKNSQEDSYDRAIKYNSKIINEKITNELKSQNIPFNINDNGMILYQSKHGGIVKQITQKYEKESSVKSPNISFTDIQYSKKFINLLKKNKIPYKISKLYNSEKDYIIWDEIYDEEVQQLILKIFDEMGITKQPHRVNFDDKEQKDYFLKLLNRESVPYRLVQDELTNPVMGPDIEYDWTHYDKVKNLVLKAQNHVRHLRDALD